ncbi:hypothetical protein T484DRAFT_1865509 [Baffinella frigidus]|nr:hypothetical protein T484DRAFT_1865509 [Cryptophyta sp. CCMP2293]
MTRSTRGVLGGILVAFFAEESIAGLDSHGVGINGIFYGDSGWRLLIQVHLS